MNVCAQALLAVLAGILADGAEVDLASPAVFSPVFYLNNYPDINITTEGGAKEHWLKTGISSGLQGCSPFHTIQYLKRYPDLGLGNNYTAAIIDYIAVGRSKGRGGYIEGGYGGRYTISNWNDTYVSASRRMGVAVDSLVWNDYEFLNAWDHGRELQIALTSPPYGECFNPTEAGGRDDDRNNTTLTQVRYVTTLDNILSTVVYPAFWLRPGDHENNPGPEPCTAGSPAVNKDLVYKYNLAKSVVFGCGVPNLKCLTFYSYITIGGTWPKHEFLQFEAPTGYLSLNFTDIYSVDVPKTRLVPQNSSLPVVMSTPEQKFAMGAYAPRGQQVDYPISYGAMKFSFASIADTTNKWNVVFRKNSTSSSTPYMLNYVVYICVGTLQMVRDCIIKVALAHPTV